LKEVAATCFLVISRTSVIITVLVRCWPRIHGILLWYIWMQRLLTSDWGQPASSFSSRYCTWIVMCLCTNRQVSVYLSVLNLISQHHILIFIYTVKPVLNGISRDQNIFPLKPGFRLIKVHYI